MPEPSVWTTEFPAFRFGSGSIDELFARLETPFLWDVRIKGVDGVERIGGPDRGVGAKFRVVFYDEDPSTCEGEIVLSERDAEGLTAAIETRFTLGETSESGSVLVRVDLAAHGDEVAYRCRLREEGDPGDAAVRALADRLRSLLRWPPLPRDELSWKIAWAIEASPESVFEPLLRPHRWNEWIARATEGRVARDRTLPPPPEIPRLAFEPWSVSGELDRSGAATGEPAATISAETPWRLIDPAGEGPAPTIRLRAIDPGRSVEFMLVWRDAAALAPEAAELDPDEPRCHLRIDTRLLATDPPWVGLAVSSQCTPPQTQQRLGRLGTLLEWLSSTDCGTASVIAARGEVAAKVEELTAPSAPTRLLSKSLVVTVALFVGLGLLIPWMREILVYLVPVLLIHELGHFIAMRLLGYRDVRMFFIPLLGAAVSGRHFNEPGWKAAVVALAGPLPGIALGVGGMAWWLFVSGPPPAWLHEALSILIILNCLQLLPIMPLDGGRVVRAVVASRLPWLDFWIFLLGSATLLAAALLVPWRPDWFLLVIGVVVALPLPWLYGRDRLTARLLREGYRPVSGEDDRISQADLDHLVDRIGEMAPNRANLANPTKVAEMAVEQYERLNHRPPGLVMSAVFLLAQFGAILLGFAAMATSGLGMYGTHWLFHGGSISQDGSRIAVASHDWRFPVLVWDSFSGRPIAALGLEYADEVEQIDIVFSADGTRLATKSRNGGRVRIWDLGAVDDRGDMVTLDAIFEGFPRTVFSPCSARIATGARDGTVRIWDAATGGELLVLGGHQSPVSRHLVFSPDGGRIAASASDYSTRVWDAQTGQALAVIEGHARGGGLAFDPTGRRIATASADHTVRIQDAGTAEELTVLAGHEGIVVEIAFSPDGNQVVTASDADTVRMWDAATGRQLAILEGPASPFRNIAFSPDGTRIVIDDRSNTSVDGKPTSPQLFDASTGQAIALLSTHFRSHTRSLFSRDGRWVVTTELMGGVQLWCALTGELVAEIPLPNPRAWWITETRHRIRGLLGLENAPPGPTPRK